MAGEANLEVYRDTLLVLGTAGVLVPVMSRYKISPVIGFLLAGAVLSSKGLGALSDVFPPINWITISNPERVGTLAELGVVFLLFLVGLELSFERLATMRKLVFGLGALQVILSASAIAFAGTMLGLEPGRAIVIGAALSLSSTAIVVDDLSAQKRMATATGRASFSILLFQDLAVVPILLLLGILDPNAKISLLEGILKALAQAVAALTVIVMVGRFMLRPLFRMVSQTGNQDMFIAATLFVAVGTSFATAAAGLSLALGAFVAGLLLAETEYRKAIETTIEPIKSLLLGVFFFSVGLSLDVSLLVEKPLVVASLTIGLLALQALIIYGLCRFYGFARSTSAETAALLAPGGEFAFVVLTLGLSYGLVSWELSSLLLTVVALSMALIPLLGSIGRKLGTRWSPPAPVNPVLSERPPEDSQSRALVVGYGRVGRLIAELLEEHGIPYIAVERDAYVVGEARAAGKPVYYGDVRQIELLHRCGLATARAAIITIHTQKDTDEIVTALRAAHPQLVIVSRARDAEHARHLYALGVNDAVPETIEASLQLSEAALVGLGIPTGLVIASIHEKRDIFRNALQGAALQAGRQSRAFPKRKSS